MLQQQDETLPTTVAISDEMKLAHNQRRKLGYRLPTEINWSNVVAIITTNNGEASNKILETIFKTWVPYLGDGADILLVTDEDDNRADDEILPPGWDNT